MSDTNPNLFPWHSEDPPAPPPTLADYTTAHGTTVKIPIGKDLYFQRVYSTYIAGGYPPSDAARVAAADVRAGKAKCLDRPPPRPVLTANGKPVMTLKRKPT